MIWAPVTLTSSFHSSDEQKLDCLHIKNGVFGCARKCVCQIPRSRFAVFFPVNLILELDFSSYIHVNFFILWNHYYWWGGCKLEVHGLVEIRKKENWTHFGIKKTCENWAWWCRLLIPALGRRRQVDLCDFKAYLGLHQFQASQGGRVRLCPERKNGRWERMYKCCTVSVQSHCLRPVMPLWRSVLCSQHHWLS